MRRAVAALDGLANPDGGWPAVPGGETSTVVTAEALLALLDWSEVPGSAAPAQPRSRRAARPAEPGRRLREQPEHPHASALALEVLLRAGRSGRARRVGDGVAAARAARGRQLGREPLPDGPRPRRPRPVHGRQPRRPRRRAGARPEPGSARARWCGSRPACATRAARRRPRPWPASTTATPRRRPARGGRRCPRSPRARRRTSPSTTRPLDRAGARHALRRRRRRRPGARVARGRQHREPLAHGRGPARGPRGPPDGHRPRAGRARGRRSHRASRSPSATAGSARRVPAPCARPSPTRRGATVVLPLAERSPRSRPGEAALASADPVEPGGRAGRTSSAPRPTRGTRSRSRTRRTTSRSGRCASLGSVPAGPTWRWRSRASIPDALAELPQAIEVRAARRERGPHAAASRPWPCSTSGRESGSASPRVSTSGTAVHSPSCSSRSRCRPPARGSSSSSWTPTAELAEADEGDNTCDRPPGRADAAISRCPRRALRGRRRGRRRPVTVTGRGPQPRDDRRPVDPRAARARRRPAGLAELARTTLSLPPGSRGPSRSRGRPSRHGEAVPLVVRVDPFDLLVERREDNNAVPLALRVRPSGLPNLAVSGADVAIDARPAGRGRCGDGLRGRAQHGCRAGRPVHRAVRRGRPRRRGHGRRRGERRRRPRRAGPGPSRSTGRGSTSRGSLGLYVVADAAGRRSRSPTRATTAPSGRSPRWASPTWCSRPPTSSSSPATRASASRSRSGPPSATSGAGRARRTPCAVAEGQSPTRVDVGTLPVPTARPRSLRDALASPGRRRRRPGAQAASCSSSTRTASWRSRTRATTGCEEVVAQDADLYLTEPVFSPNGDGVKDETTLAWRATGRVRVVVSNAAGRGDADARRGRPGVRLRDLGRAGRARARRRTGPTRSF